MLIPHPSFAHPSPSMGGELVITAGLFDSPPLLGAGSWQGGRGSLSYEVKGLHKKNSVDLTAHAGYNITNKIT